MLSKLLDAPAPGVWSENTTKYWSLQMAAFTPGCPPNSSASRALPHRALLLCVHALVLALATSPTWLATVTAAAPAQLEQLHTGALRVAVVSAGTLQKEGLHVPRLTPSSAKQEKSSG